MRRGLMKKLSPILMLWCGAAVFAQTPSGAASAATANEVNVTQIMGFEGTAKNTKGKLSIQDTALQFQKSGDTAVQIRLAAIQDVVLGEENRQVGGLPMTLGKVATPYGGGRVVSLFSHKKFDTLTVQYLDSNGAWHGAIFELVKGEAESFRSELITKGAHVVHAENKAAKQNAPEVSSESK
jgi:hypothetical protein